MYQVQLSREYEDDYNMIGFEMGSFGYYESTINKVLNHIDKQVDLLVDNPHLGARLDSISTIPNDFRYLVSSDYIQFYKVYDNVPVDGYEGLVRVFRILHGKTDYLVTLGLTN